MRGIASCRRSLVELLWPSRCPVCGRESEDGAAWIWGSSAGYPLLHVACLEQIPLSPSPARTHPSARIRVDWCLEDCPEFFRILHAVKYDGQWELLDVLTTVFVLWARGILPTGGRWALVPIPDDPVRRRQRGASLVEALAAALERAGLGRRASGLLRRRRSAPPQARIESAARRARNVVTLFGTGDLARLSPHDAVVLLDDQVTTGATVREASALMALRGHRVRVLALAGARTAPRWLGP